MNNQSKIEGIKISTNNKSNRITDLYLEDEFMLKQLKNLTLGVEEEYQLIDPKSRELTSYITEILEDGSVIFRDEVIRISISKLFR